MTEKYYIIRNSDGDTYVEEKTRAELMEMFAELKEYEEDPDFLDKITEADTNYWGEGSLIIKGSIVTPFEKKTVTEYDIE
jgi:hypothetical protein